MKQIYIFILSALLVLTLASCGDKDKQKELNERLYSAISEKNAAEKQTEVVKGEKNIVIGVSIAAVFLALIIGSMLGAKARKDVKKEPTKENEKSE